MDRKQFRVLIRNCFFLKKYRVEKVLRKKFVNDSEQCLAIFKRVIIHNVQVSSNKIVSVLLENFQVVSLSEMFSNFEQAIKIVKNKLTGLCFYRNLLIKRFVILD